MKQILNFIFLIAIVYFLGAFIENRWTHWGFFGNMFMIAWVVINILALIESA